jgi:hypothetical protein
MATYTAPFQRDAISEVVPRALELSSLSKSSLLTGRRRIRVIPQTGQTYGGPTASGAGQPTIANILLQDSAGLLDMQSVVLSMNIQTQNTAIQATNNSSFQNGLANDGTSYTGAATTSLATVDPYLAAAMNGRATSLAGQAVVPGSLAITSNPNMGKQNALTVSETDPIRTAVLDDFAWSVFRRIQVSLNSQLVDDLDYCGRRATTEVYMSASPNWYETIGTVMGAWKYVSTQAVQPLLVRPTYSGAAGTLTVATYPIKSAVDAYRWKGYITQHVAKTVTLSTEFGTMTYAGPPPVAAPTGTPVNTGAPAQPTADWTIPDITSLDTKAKFDAQFPYGSSGVALNFSVVANVTATGPGVVSTQGSGNMTLTVSRNAAGVVTSAAWTGTVVIPLVNGGVQVVFQPNGVSPLGGIALLNASGNQITAWTLKFNIEDEQSYVSPIGVDNDGAVSTNGVPVPVYPYVMAGTPGLVATGQPLGASPFAASAVARDDVLGKVYNSSRFFQNAYFVASVGGSGAWPTPVPKLGSTTDAITSGQWYARNIGHKFSIPMGLLSHLFRQEQLFPLRNAGQLILQIQFADPVECCFAAPVVFDDPADGDNVNSLTQGGIAYGGAAISSFGTPYATYTVNNLELECDIVTAIPEYTAILDSICSRPADKGLAIAFDSHLSSLQQVTAPAGLEANNAMGSGQDQTFTLIASKGSENVRSFHFTMSPTAGLRNYEYLQNSTFPAYDMQQWQIRVGSVYYPAFPSKGLSKNYMEMLSSVNAPMPSVGQASLISYSQFRSSTPTVAWLKNTTPLGGRRYVLQSGVFTDLASVTVGSSKLAVPDPETNAYADGYIGGYCFDNLKHAEPLSHDGLDTRAIAGGMIQLDFTCRPLEPFAVVFHIRFTRTIVLAENGVSIVG